MARTYCIIFCALWLMMSSLVAFSHADALPNPIKVVMDNNYPPFIFQGSDGKPQGILVDQWHLWEQKTGIKVEISAMDWAKALSGMKAGDFDVIDTVFKTEERSNWLDFSKAYAKLEVPIFFDNKISGITDATSLRGFVVAAKTGDAAVDLLKRNGVEHLVLYNSYESIVLAAKEHKTSVFVIDKPPALYYLYKYGINDHFNQSSPLNVGEFHRAVKKGNMKLLKAVEEGFGRISPSELKKIDTQWYGSSLPVGNYLRFPLIGAGILGLFVLILSFYNRNLRKAVNARTAELKTSKELFERVYNSVNDAIIIHDIETGAIIDVNDRMQEMYGLNREEAISSKVEAFSSGTPPYSQTDALAWINKAVEGEPQLFEWRAKHRDGRLFWTEVNMRRARIGDVDRVLVTVRDITDRKAAEEAIKSSQDLFAAAFQGGPLLMTISDVETGRYQEVNDNFLAVSGFTREEVLGKTSTEVGWLSSQDRDALVSEMRTKGRISGMKLRVARKSGESRWCLYFGEIISLAGERKLLSIAEDITERKSAEEQLRQAMKMDAVGQLAGGVAHDYNNMLTVIIGSAELLKRYTTHDPQSMKLVSAIIDAATRSADLTHQLLTFSRKGERATVKFSIKETILAAVSLLEHSIDKSISLETRFIAPNTLVSGDPSLLQNALLNLGINARDAMPKGGTITFATANVDLDDDFCASHANQVTPGQYLEISVSDTGIGMKKDVLEHIFEPFFTTKAVGEGTGLGLAMVYGTVKDHRGHIDVYSEPGIGTVFKLYIPVSEGLESGADQVEEVVSGSGGILLVDDEPMLRSVGQELLGDLGYRVYLAEDGEEALEVYAREKENISLVILDMVMPKMGGKETLARLVENYPGIKVLISSGFHQEETREVLTNLGARGFVQKPYRRSDLIKAVSEALK